MEEILDTAHALMEQGVFRYRRPPKLSLAKQQESLRDRLEYEERSYNDLCRTLPSSKSEDRANENEGKTAERRRSLNLPEENLLYFLEKNSLILQPWQREILRIVRVIAQYFYPQRQTQVMNEGCATFCHYTLVNALFDRGLISEGTMLEVLRNHSNVIFQPTFDDPRYGGINPYALGLDMMQDIQRISTDPTEEDRDWFPDIAGKSDWRATLLDAWANHRDESFIRQYLSPTLIRKWRLFVLSDMASEPHYEVASIHNERGYQQIRSALAHSYDIGANCSDIQIVDVDLLGDRQLRLAHKVSDGILLENESCSATLRHIRRLWGYPVSLVGVDANTGTKVYERLSE